MRDVALGYLKPVLEESVQEHPTTVALDLLRTTGSAKVYLDGVDPMNLLIGVRRPVSDRHHEHQKLWVFLCDFGKDLNEVERPVPRRFFLCVPQT